MQLAATRRVFQGRGNYPKVCCTSARFISRFYATSINVFNVKTRYYRLEVVDSQTELPVNVLVRTRIMLVASAITETEESEKRRSPQERDRDHDGSTLAGSNLQIAYFLRTLRETLKSIKIAGFYVDRAPKSTFQSRYHPMLLFFN